MVGPQIVTDGDIAGYHNPCRRRMLPPLFQRLSGRRIRWIVIGVVSLSLVLFSSENRTTPTSFSAVGGLLSTKTGKEERAHVRFVPYPHRNIGSGEALSCSWRSRESLSPEAVESLVGRAEPIDLVQDLTLSNGVCLPISGSFLEQLHLYSANQARNCLKNRTLIVSGDSSAFGLFVGLGDVLLGRPLRFSGNDEHSRSTILQSTIEVSFRVYVRHLSPSIQLSLQDVQLSTTKDDSFPNLRWECQQSCDGRRSSHQIPACSDCLRQLRHHAQKRDAVVVVGNEAPMLLASNESEVRSFSMVQKSLKVLYALSPTANAATSNRPFVGSSSSYWRSLRLMKKHAIPVADFFQMTRACCLNDTTTEEGRVRRYVNRWKAIQVLNILCEYREGPVNTPSIVQRSEFFEPAIPSSRKSSPPVGKEDRKGPPAEKGSGSSTHGFLRHEQTEEGDRHASRNQSHSANTSQVLASFSNLKPAPQSLELEEPPVNETTIRQVGFPHNDLGVGTAAVCWWVPKDQGDVDDGVVSSLLGGDLLSPDAIQARAFEETICVPESKAGLSKLHLFSTLEARTCLSNVTVALTGDSYSRQLFIGLSEILLANPSNDHIRNGSQRIAVLKESGDVSALAL